MNELAGGLAGLGGAALAAEGMYIFGRRAFDRMEARANLIPEGGEELAIAAPFPLIQKRRSRKVALYLWGTLAVHGGVDLLTNWEYSGDLDGISSVTVCDFSTDERDYFIKHCPEGILDRTSIMTASTFPGGIGGLSASEVMHPNIRKWWYEPVQNLVLAGGSQARGSNPRKHSPRRPFLQQGNTPSVALHFISSGGHFGIGITGTVLNAQLFPSPRTKHYAITQIPELPPLRDQFAEGFDMLRQTGVPQWVIVSDEWKGRDRIDRDVSDFIEGVTSTNVDIDNPLRHLGNGVVVLRSASELLPVYYTDAKEPRFFTLHEPAVAAVNAALEAAEDSTRNLLDLPVAAPKTVSLYIVKAPFVAESLKHVKSRVEGMLADAGWFKNRSRKLLWHTTRERLHPGVTDVPVRVVVAEAAIGGTQHIRALLAGQEEQAQE